MENRLSHLQLNATTMDPREIRAELMQIEEAMFQQLLNKRRGFHPRVSLNTSPLSSSASAFG